MPRSAACGMRGLGSTSCRETTKVPVRTRWDAVHTIQSLSHIEIGRANGYTSTGTQTDRLSVRDGTDTVLHPTPHELDRARDVEAPISDACVAVRRGLKMSSLPSVFVWAGCRLPKSPGPRRRHGRRSIGPPTWTISNARKVANRVRCGRGPLGDGRGCEALD